MHVFQNVKLLIDMCIDIRQILLVYNGILI